MNSPVCFNTQWESSSEIIFLLIVDISQQFGFVITALLIFPKQLLGIESGDHFGLTVKKYLGPVSPQQINLP